MTSDVEYLVGAVSAGDQSDFQVNSDYNNKGRLHEIYSTGTEAPDERGSGGTAIMIGDSGYSTFS